MTAILDEISKEIAETFLAQAKAKGLSVDDYLKNLLGAAERASAGGFASLYGGMFINPAPKFSKRYFTSKIHSSHSVSQTPRLINRRA